MTTQTVTSIPTNYAAEANAPLDLYLIQSGHVSALIDAGISTSPAAGTSDAIGRSLADGELETILITHAHVDHVGGAAELRREFGARILVPRDEVSWAEDPTHQWRAFWETYSDFVDVNEFREQILAWSGPSFRADGVVSHEDSISVGESGVSAILTRGHSPGHTCYFAQEARVVFTGDFLQGWGNPWADGRYVSPPLYESVDEYLSGLDALRRLPFDAIATAHVGLLDRPQGLKALEESVEFVQTVEGIVAERAAATTGLDVPTLALAIAELVGGEPRLTVQSVGTARAHLRYGVASGRLHVDSQWRFRS